MQHRPLGRTGVMVSQICFGTMSFGNEADEETSGAMFHRCREAGINFFDCANVYGHGRSEEILGKLLAGVRDDIVLTSKVHGAMGQDINAKGGSRRHILLAVEASLKRLKTDRLDIYFLHRFADGTPIEETLRAFDDLVRQGKILYPAASNWAAWQVAKALGISAAQGLARFECLQPMYNLVKRQAEVEIFPMALSEQVAVITYSPLAGGLLTGKYAAPSDPGRLQTSTIYKKRYGSAENFDLAQRFAAFARSRGFHPASLAIAWVGSHPGVTAPIIGARNLDQLEPSLRSIDIPMIPALRREISALSVDPAPANDRSEEHMPL